MGTDDLIAAAILFVMGLALGRFRFRDSWPATVAYATGLVVLYAILGWLDDHGVSSWWFIAGALLWFVADIVYRQRRQYSRRVHECAVCGNAVPWDDKLSLKAGTRRKHLPGTSYGPTEYFCSPKHLAEKARADWALGAIDKGAS